MSSRRTWAGNTLARLGMAALMSTVLITASAGYVPATRAATPPSGTLDGSAPLEWDFAAVAGGTATSEGVETICPPLMCDPYAMTLALPSDPATFYATNMATLTIHYTWNSMVPTDMDIFAFGPNGAKHGPGSPDNVSTGAGAEDLVITDPLPGVWSVRSVATITPVPTAAHAYVTLTFAPRPAAPNPVPAPGDPAFVNYAAPYPLLHQSGEPSIGVDRATGNVMYAGAGCVSCNPTVAKVSFNNSLSPAVATWTDVTHPLENHVTADPILFTDPATHRTFDSQLDAACSITMFSDDDGANWTPSQGCGVPAGADHQTIGGGPYAPSTGTSLVGPLTSYPDAVYYCSQDIATAFCARSDNGGLTFGPGVPVWNLTTCGGIHGHVKVGPDGTVYVPNRSCTGADGKSHQGVAVSHDNGQTWSIYTVNDSGPKGSDPAIAVGPHNTLYFGYQNSDGHPRVAVSHDEGKTWSKSIDIGAPFGIQNSQFPEAVSGDDNRAAIAFLGTSALGDDQASDFTGAWHLYTAYTYDGGLTWTTVDATPNDPVQRGCIWNGGGNNPCRNLADFNDVTVDTMGRVLVAYTDGCTGACVNDPNAATASAATNYEGSYARVGAIARQSGGKGLYAAYDGTNLGGGTSGDDTCYGNAKGMSHSNGRHCHAHT